MGMWLRICLFKMNRVDICPSLYWSIASRDWFISGTPLLWWRPPLQNGLALAPYFWKIKILLLARPLCIPYPAWATSLLRMCWFLVSSMALSIRYTDWLSNRHIQPLKMLLGQWAIVKYRRELERFSRRVKTRQWREQMFAAWMVWFYMTNRRQSSGHTSKLDKSHLSSEHKLTPTLELADPQISAIRMKQNTTACLWLHNYGMTALLIH